MVVLAIAAIIAAVAIPSYQSAVQRSRRADAMSALGEIAQAQERWRANNALYKNSLTDLPGIRPADADGDFVSRDGHYKLSMVAGSVSATSYTARAIARDSSPQASDTDCTTMNLAMSQGNVVYSPATCWVR